MAHTTIMRWVHQYGPELDERVRLHLKPTNDSWRVDETYNKVKAQWMYLYRAVDSEGITIDFYLSESRDKQAAKRFFKKTLATSHVCKTRVHNSGQKPSLSRSDSRVKRKETYALRHTNKTSEISQ
ncbi:DDE-type integrase/transposase/recombinase [Peribacillus frigoritolerans]|uniref:DDE-type integrase/transposase/recombinase n=1 Tax=Peribacillus frigoritolerans TaxID=450367 RepID=UPI003D2D24C9